MKVKLLNDGLYPSLYGVKFPAEVEAIAIGRYSCSVTVKGSELVRIGGLRNGFAHDGEYFFTSDEFEVVE